MARLTLAATLLCLGCAAAAQLGGDAEMQILYAFHTEDSNRLQSLVQAFASQEQSGTDATLRYHRAHAEYRLGLLLTDASRAAAAFDACIEQLKAILEQDANSVESLGLQSACYRGLASRRKFEAMLLRAHADADLRHAAALAPRNPRILLFEAEADPARSDAVGGARATAQLELAAHSFEQAAALDDTPGWGDAEAYLELGRRLRAYGDLLGARNWIEKALLAAPDYKAARRERAALLLR